MSQDVKTGLSGECGTRGIRDGTSAPDQDGLGLLDPDDIEALHRLELADALSQPDERKSCPVLADDVLATRDIEMMQTNLVDLLLQQILHRLVDRELNFTSAENA